MVVRSGDFDSAYVEGSFDEVMYIHVCVYINRGGGKEEEVEGEAKWKG